MVSDETGFREFRMAFFTVISEFERLCDCVKSGVGTDKFNYIFPWYKSEKDLGPLPDVEASIEEFKKLFGEDE